jgi:DNA adenine methylase
MTNDQHRELAEVLHGVKGKVALSGYQSPLMQELYSDWRYIEGLERLVHSVKMPRTEVLWINYNLEDEAAWQIQQQSWQMRLLEQQTTYQLPL